MLTIGWLDFSLILLVCFGLGFAISSIFHINDDNPELDESHAKTRYDMQERTGADHNVEPRT